jgi:hypothetical protein
LGDGFTRHVQLATRATPNLPPLGGLRLVDHAVLEIERVGEGDAPGPRAEQQLVGGPIGERVPDRGQRVGSPTLAVSKRRLATTASRPMLSSWRWAQGMLAVGPPTQPRPCSRAPAGSAGAAFAGAAAAG